MPQILTSTRVYVYGAWRPACFSLIPIKCGWL